MGRAERLKKMSISQEAQLWFSSMSLTNFTNLVFSQILLILRIFAIWITNSFQIGRAERFEKDDLSQDCFEPQFEAEQWFSSMSFTNFTNLVFSQSLFSKTSQNLCFSQSLFFFWKSANTQWGPKYQHSCAAG